MAPRITSSDFRAPPGEDIALVVVDDHPVLRQEIAIALEGAPIKIVGYAHNGADAISLISRLKPDVVLLDLVLPDMLARDLLGMLRCQSPTTEVIVFTPRIDQPELDAALEAGARACIIENIGSLDLVTAIQRVAGGDAIGTLAGYGLASTVPHDLEIPLTRREYEILQLVAMGKTNREIAQTLGLAANTVKTYWQRALQKLGVRNRAQAIMRAHELRLL